MCCFFTLYRCVFAFSVHRLHFTVKERGKEKGKSISEVTSVTLMDTINLQLNLVKSMGEMEKVCSLCLYMKTAFEDLSQTIQLSRILLPEATRDLLFTPAPALPGELGRNQGRRTSNQHGQAQDQGLSMAI